MQVEALAAHVPAPLQVDIGGGRRRRPNLFGARAIEFFNGDGGAGELSRGTQRHTRRASGARATGGGCTAGGLLATGDGRRGDEVLIIMAPLVRCISRMHGFSSLRVRSRSGRPNTRRTPTAKCERLRVAFGALRAARRASARFRQAASAASARHDRSDDSWAEWSGSHDLIQCVPPRARRHRGTAPRGAAESTAAERGES